MKILHLVEFYSPSVGGAQEVVRQLSEHMVLMGHDVTVATTKLLERKQRKINGVVIKEFSIKGNAVNGFSGEIDDYKKFLVSSHFDAIMVYAAQQWTADIFFEVMDQVKAKKTFVPCGFSGLFDPRYKSYFDRMPEILRKFNATIYLSNNYRDINYAKKHHVSNIHIIPNAADEREFLKSSQIDIRAKLKIPRDTFLFLSVGSHSNLKGHNETIQIFNLVNRKNSTLLIVGRKSESRCYKHCKRSELLDSVNPLTYIRKKHIYVRDLSRQETLAAYETADAFLFPSNIECSPLVLFESAASRTPFFASNVGNSKEIAAWLKCGYILPTKIDNLGYSHVDIKQSAAYIAKTIKDLKMLTKIGEIGYINWACNYSWDNITKKYLDIYSEKK